MSSNITLADGRVIDLVSIISPTGVSPTLSAAPSAGLSSAIVAATNQPPMAAMAMVDATNEAGYVFLEGRRNLGDGDVTGWNSLFVSARGSVYNGSGWDRQRIPGKFVPQNAVAVNAETTIWTPAAGKKFRLMRATVASSVAGNLILRDNTAGTIILVIPTLAGAPITFDLGNGILSAAANNVLTCIGPAASTLSGFVCGTEE